MKYLLALPMLGILVGCGTSRSVSDGAVSDYSVSGIRVSRTITRNEKRIDVHLDALDKEAAELTIKFWKPVKIEDSWFHHQILTSSRYPGKTRVLVQLKNATARVEPNFVSEADSLNGIEWHGKVCLDGSPARERVLESINSPATVDAGWPEWRNTENVTEKAEKVRGKWKIDTGDLSRVTYEPVDASKIPK